jgi:hypothetical protein
VWEFPNLGNRQTHPPLTRTQLDQISSPIKPIYYKRTHCTLFHLPHATSLGELENTIYTPRANIGFSRPQIGQRRLQGASAINRTSRSCHPPLPHIPRIGLPSTPCPTTHHPNSSHYQEPRRDWAIQCDSYSRNRLAQFPLHT